MNTNNTSVINTRFHKVVVAGLIGMASVLATSQASADRYRTVVVHETVRSSPAIVVHSSPVYVSHAPVVYVPVHAPIHHSAVVYAPGSHTSYISSGHQTVSTTTRTTTTVRSHGNAYGHGGYTVVSHPGNRHGHHAKHSPSRGSWSSNRRDVIYVDHRGARNSSYREAEHRSVVIRDRSR